MLEIIEVHNRSMKILREDFWDFSVDAWFSKIFEKTLENQWITLEKFYNEEIKGLKPDWKDIYVFCAYDYKDINKFIYELENEWYKDIKSSEIYLYLNNKLEKYG